MNLLHHQDQAARRMPGTWLLIPEKGAPVGMAGEKRDVSALGGAVEVVGAVRRGPRDLCGCNSGAAGHGKNP